MSNVLLSIPNQNVEVTKLDDGRISITFDPTKSLGMSSTGKSMLISSTRGNIAVDNFTVGLSVYRKVK